MMVLRKTILPNETDDSSTDEDMDVIQTERGNAAEQKLIEAEHAKDEESYDDSEDDGESEKSNNESENEESSEEISGEIKQCLQDRKRFQAIVAGWADAMAKVLRSGKDNDKLILSKAKKDYETTSKEPEKVFKKKTSSLKSTEVTQKEY